MNSSTANKAKNPRDEVIDNIIKNLENNPGAWQKTWSTLTINRPTNPITGTKYTGINLINLALLSSSFDDNRWATYDQALKAGFPVKKGEKSHADIVFHKANCSLFIADKKYKLKSTNANDMLAEIKGVVNKYHSQFYTAIEKSSNVFELEKSLQQIDENNKIQKSILYKKVPVFNFSQLTNAPEIIRDFSNLGLKWEDNTRAEQLITATNVPIIHDQVDRNFYLPSKHEIHATIKRSFDTPSAYYSTIFHELAHAKMNDQTIDLGIDFTKYHEDKNIRAKEELRAEISSVFICAELSIDYNVVNHASYIKSWIKILKEDKNELWSAISDSNKVANKIIDLEKLYKKDLENYKATKESNAKEPEQKTDVEIQLKEESTQNLQGITL